MHHQIPLFTCYYFPLSVILVIGSIGVFSSFLIFSHIEISDLFFTDSWSEFFIHQPLVTWLVITFITSICIMASQAKLIVTDNEIYIESFSVRFITVVEKSQVQRLQLYHHHKSRKKRFKPLKQNQTLSIEALHQTSTLGISLKPNYRKEFKMPSIDLKQLPKQDRLKFLNVLSHHWGLDPKNIAGFDDLVDLKFKHKLR